MRQLTIFFSLAYLISWTIWFPLYSGPLFGLYGLPVLPCHHGIGGLGPLIAAFITTRLYYGKEGVIRLFNNCLQARPLIYLIIALFSPFLLILLAAIISVAIDGAPLHLGRLWTIRTFSSYNLISFFIYNLVFFGFGEEVGWRGFALPRMQSVQRAFPATFLLSVLWALWHLPLFLYRTGYTGADVSGTIGWFFSLLTGSVLLTWMYNSTRGSILVCAVFHTAVDIVFTTDLANQNITTYLGFLITVWGIITIIIFKPRNLSRHRRQKIDMGPKWQLQKSAVPTGPDDQNEPANNE